VSHERQLGGMGTSAQKMVEALRVTDQPHPMGQRPLLEKGPSRATD